MTETCGAASAALHAMSTTDTSSGEVEGSREGFEPARSRERPAVQSFPSSVEIFS
jgi:hypothetical protein